MSLFNKYNSMDRESPAYAISDETEELVRGLLKKYPNENPREIQEVVLDTVHCIVSEHILIAAIRMRKDERANG